MGEGKGGKRGNEGRRKGIGITRIRVRKWRGTQEGRGGGGIVWGRRQCGEGSGSGQGSRSGLGP